MLITRITLRVITGYLTLEYIIIRKLIFVNLWSERREHFNKVINAKFLANKIRMNPTLLSQYVQGRKKPSAAQTEKILFGIHQIGQELSEINLIHRP